MTPKERKRAALDRKNARRRAQNAAKRGLEVTPPPPAKPGPPFIEVTPAKITQVETAAGYGLTIRAIAALVFGCSDTTFRAICRRDVRVVDALGVGQAKAALNVGEALYNKALRGDVPAIRWFEMTRQGRAERVEGALQAHVLNESLDEMDEDSRNQRIAEVLRMALQRRDNVRIG